jgi:type I restriction enzyme R subunit
VNRLHDSKEYGYVIDYRGILEDIHLALDLYGKLAEFDPADLEGTLTDIRAVIVELPQRHSAVWDVFRDVANKRDEEAYELLLGNEERRMEFYERFSAFARTLALALSSEAFLEETPDRKVIQYKRDLKFFAELRHSVRRRYAEVVDFSEYEPKIKKLLDTYLGTGQVETVIGKIDLFDKAVREQALGKATSDTAKADLIAHNTMHVMDDHWQEDPAFYEKFSKMLQDAIDANRAGRLREAAYLQVVLKVEGSVLTRTDEDVPASLRHKDLAARFFRNMREVFRLRAGEGVDAQACCAEASEAIEEIILRRSIVNWTTNDDVQKQMRQESEDYLFALVAPRGVILTFDDIDAIMDKCIDIAKARTP